MKVISLLAQKGGTGKCTLTAHLAVEGCRIMVGKELAGEIDAMWCWVERRN